MSKNNSTTKMASKDAFTIHTYTRSWGRWSVSTDIEFHDVENFHGSKIIRNTIKYNNFLKERGDNNLTPDFLETLDVSNNDPCFPQVKVSGGPKLFTEEEYNEAKTTVNNQKKNLDSVVDIKGIMTTPDAEFDRAMVYEATEKAKQIIAAYDQQLKTEKLLDEIMPNWRNK